jgi:hypothetical protein
MVQDGSRAWGIRVAETLFAIWIGAMIAIAFVAAPLVFRAVPEYIATKDLAGRVIGPAFGRIDLLGAVACTGVLLVLLKRRSPSRWRRGAIGLLLVGSLVDGLWIAPQITARAEPLRVYHGAATGIWMTAILLGLFLLLVGLTGSRDD